MTAGASSTGAIPRFPPPGEPETKHPESVLELSLPTLSLSVVDGAEEIAFLSLDGVEAHRASGLGVAGGSGAMELAVAALQVDDPHPGAAFPVVAWHDPERGPLLRATLTSVTRDVSHAEMSALNSGHQRGRAARVAGVFVPVLGCVF